MASSCVLLDRFVYFVDDPALGEASEEEEFDDGTWDEVPSLEGAPSWETITKSITDHLEAMKPDPQVSAPPEVSYLSLVRPSVASGDCDLQFGRQLHSGVITAADNNIVVLHAGSYRPGHSSTDCYLVYDARSDILSAVPAIPLSVSCSSIGNGTVVAAAPDTAGAGTFVLAEMFRSRSTPSEGVLCVWSQEKQVWIEKAGRLPAEVCRPMNRFCAHMSFFSKGKFYWVDLLHGLLIWDLEQSPADGSHAEFCFVQLPDGDSIDNTCYSRPKGFRTCPSPREFRTVASVDGTIKFVNLDGYLQRSRPADELGIFTWTLSMDGFSPSWSVETTFCLKDLWADDMFISMGLPKIKPMYPMLNMQEHGVAYLVLADPRTHFGRQAERVQYLVSIDTRRNKVLSSTNSIGKRCFWREIIASNFHLFLPGSKDHKN